MAKVLKTVGMVVAGVALVATGLGAVALPGLAGAVSIFGVSSTALFAAGAALSTVGGLLQKRPKVSPATHDRLNVSLTVDTPRKIVFGRTALSTDLRYQEWNGADQDLIDQVIVLATHRITSVEEIWLDEKLAWVPDAAQGTFAGYFRADEIFEGARGSGFTIEKRRWTPATAPMVGCAQLHLRFKTSGNGKKATSPFSSSIPSRITIVGKAAPVYDPRFDSTAGGSGAMRVADQSTWAFAAGGRDIGRNNALCLLWYLLGWRIRNPSTGEWKLAAGCGVPVERIDLDSFITAANMCDETVLKADGSSEPRYRCDGTFSEGDAPSEVIAALEASMNAKLRDSAGRFTLQVFHNDLATPVVDFTDDDVLGDYEWDAGNPLNDGKNIVSGKYVDASETSLYQLIDYPSVKLASPDGIDRPDPFDLALVQSPGQAQRLAKQRLQRRQYGGTFKAEFNAKGWAVKDGDVVRLRFAAAGFDYKLFRVAEGTIDTTGRVPLVLVEENAAIYAWDKEEAPAVQAAVPNTFDPLQDIIVQAIDEAGKTAEWPNVLDPNGTRPADNATNSADPNSPFGDGGKTVAQVIKSLGDIVQSVGDLEATYGDTASAEQSKNAAQAARDAADQAAVTATAKAVAADGSAAAAGGSATVAGTKANEAGASASAANASVLEAQGYAGDSQTSAIASEASSVSAGQKAAAAEQSATISASVGAGLLNTNASFTSYDAARLLPTGWDDWSYGTSGISLPSGGAPGGYYENDSDPSSKAEVGIRERIYLTKGYYVLEFGAWCRAGDWGGAGMSLVDTVAPYAGIAFLNCASDPDMSDTTGVQAPGVRRWQKFVYVDRTGPVDQFAYVNWTAYGTSKKTLRIFRSGIRPASDAEVAGKKALADSATALAQIKSEAKTRSEETYALTTKSDTLTAVVNARPNLVKDVDTWSKNQVVYGLGTWGANLYGTPSLIGLHELARSPSFPVDQNTIYTASADLLQLGGSPGAWAGIDLLGYRANGSLAAQAPVKIAVGRNFDDSRDRATFSVPLDMKDSAYGVMRLLGYSGSDSNGSMGAIGLRKPKTERGQTVTAYTVEGQVASLSAQVSVQQGVLADITNNKLKAFWQVAVDVGGTGRAGIVVAAEKADGTTTSAVEIYGAAMRFWRPAAGASTDPNAYALGMAYENDTLRVYGKIIADNFLDSQGVDLRALIPGSLNFRLPASWNGSQHLAGSESMVVAGTAMCTVSGHTIQGDLSVTLKSDVDSGGAENGVGAMSVNIDVVASVNGGAWQTVVTGVSAGAGNQTRTRTATFGPIDLTISGSTQFAVRVTHDSTTPAGTIYAASVNIRSSFNK